MEPRPLFVPAGPRSAKVMCLVCGRTGWGPTEPDPAGWVNPWQRSCLGGHEYPCAICPKRYATRQQLAGHRRKAHPALRFVGG